jgi:hypothetical protein
MRKLKINKIICKRSTRTFAQNGAVGIVIAPATGALQTTPHIMEHKNAVQ